MFDGFPAEVQDHTVRDNFGLLQPRGEYHWQTAASHAHMGGGNCYHWGVRGGHGGYRREFGKEDY